MAHEDDFVIFRILDDAMRRMKNHLKTFFTKLTNAQNIMLQTINKKKNFNEGGGIVTSRTMSNDSTFPIVSEGYVPSFSPCEEGKF